MSHVAYQAQPPPRLYAFTHDNVGRLTRRGTRTSRLKTIAAMAFHRAAIA